MAAAAAAAASLHASASGMPASAATSAAPPIQTTPLHLALPQSTRWSTAPRCWPTFTSAGRTPPRLPRCSRAPQGCWRAAAASCSARTRCAIRAAATASTCPHSPSGERAALQRRRAALSAACPLRRRAASPPAAPHPGASRHLRDTLSATCSCRNVYAFSQDRPTSTRLTLLPDGSVAWTTYVQARPRRLPAAAAHAAHPLACTPAELAPPHRRAALPAPVHLPPSAGHFLSAHAAAELPFRLLGSVN